MARAGERPALGAPTRTRAATPRQPTLSHGSVTFPVPAGGVRPYGATWDTSGADHQARAIASRYSSLQGRSALDTLSVLRIGARRWYVTAPVLAVFAFLVWRAYDDRQQVFTVSGTAIILPDSRAEAGGSFARNPYAISGGVALLTNALIIDLQSAQVRAQVLDSGGDANYTITPTDRNSPILSIVATGEDPARLAETVRRVTQLGSERALALQRQAGATGPLLRLLDLVPPGPPSVATSNVRRLLAALVVLGLVTALALAVCFEAASRRAGQRRARRRHRAAGAACETSAEAPSSTEAVQPTEQRFRPGPLGEGYHDQQRDPLAQIRDPVAPAEPASNADRIDRARPDPVDATPHFRQARPAVAEAAQEDEDRSPSPPEPTPTAPDPFTTR